MKDECAGVTHEGGTWRPAAFINSNGNQTRRDGYDPERVST
jgi:hypothetical protein